MLTEFHRFLKRSDKEQLLGQRGVVLWLYGLSGSGKSTIANLAERTLHDQGRMTAILDGDNIRTGLNAGLGFSDEDRAENIRRLAEVAKLFADQGIITFVSAITPRRAFREQARSIIGPDFHEIHVQADWETCAERDPKGLYAKAKAGKIPQFTGRDSTFEPPDSPNLTLNTKKFAAKACAENLIRYLKSL